MTQLWTRRLGFTFLLVCLISSTIRSGVRASQLTDSIDQQDNGNYARVPSGFQIVSSTATSLVLDIHGPSSNLETNTVNGTSCQILNAEGYIQNDTPGEPGLISAGVMLGIPPTTIPSFTIQSIETVEIPDQYHICPIATPIIQPNLNGMADYQGEISRENTLLYSQDDFLPSQPIVLVASGMIRSQRVARLSFTPFQYNPAREELRYISHIRVEILFGVDNLNGYSSTWENEGLFEPILQHTLINYEQARPWRLQGKVELLTPGDLPQNSLNDQPKFKIQVEQDGIYQVTYAALQLAGVPVDSLDPRTIRLLNQSVEIPIVVIGEEDGEFNPTDYLLFYGQKNNTKYSNANIYWLSWGIEYGLRMASKDGTVYEGISPVSFNALTHLEEDQRYINNSPSGLQNDHWYWYFLNATNGPVSHDFTFSLKNLDTSSTTIGIRGLFKGYFANPLHHTRVYLNSNLVDDHTWPSTSEYSFSINIPRSYLNEGSNTITVECPLDGGITIDQVLVNWFEIENDHTFTSENNLLDFSGDQPGKWQFQVQGFNTDSIDLFDITSPSATARVIGGNVIPDGSLYQISFEQQVSSVYRYLALSPSRWLTPELITQDNPSDFTNPNNGADYIIISHADFMSAVQPLVTFRTNQGLRVKVVDVQDVYDEFNGGIVDPQAVQKFLAYTYSNWIAPAPAYVLLVGDGHYDYKNNYGDSGINRIPPFLGEFDPWIGETAADNHYVTISGDDNLPDMFIGRLPVNSTDETTAMVNKILSYEHSPNNEDWNYNLSFVADNADTGGNFPVFSDNLIDNYLPDEYVADKIYYSIDPYFTVPDTRAAILTAINQGSLIVTYLGHGGVQLWAAENLFHVNSIVSLTNTGKYPFITPLTCLEGYFIYPNAQGYNYPSLDESLVRSSDKGAIGSFSPAGFGLSSGHDILAQGLYQAFFSDGMTQFGPATTFAKYYLDANGPGYSDLIDTYNLFGDPATRLNIPIRFSINLPLVIK